jgi:hypothetical protein
VPDQHADPFAARGADRQRLNGERVDRRIRSGERDDAERRRQLRRPEIG